MRTRSYSANRRGSTKAVEVRYGARSTYWPERWRTSNGRLIVWSHRRKRTSGRNHPNQICGQATRAWKNSDASTRNCTAKKLMSTPRAKWRHGFSRSMSFSFALSPGRSRSFVAPNRMALHLRHELLDANRSGSPSRFRAALRLCAVRASPSREGVFTHDARMLHSSQGFVSPPALSKRLPTPTHSLRNSSFALRSGPSCPAEHFDLCTDPGGAKEYLTLPFLQNRSRSQRRLRFL